MKLNGKVVFRSYGCGKSRTKALFLQVGKGFSISIPFKNNVKEFFNLDFGQNYAAQDVIVEVTIK